ncbi:MAG TPA: hypothetical protein VGR62_24000 [Candidatus Binatia bacterium]|nr:hypothetical protein [Candidatus Binatia bacterium]
MPGTGATAVVLRQLGRVRRRLNALTVQRLAYGIIAVGACSATVVLLLAMRATPVVFAVGSGLTVAGFVVAATVLTRTTSRRWLRRAHAAAWVDRTTGLEGRLLTLSQIGARDDEAFVALLERQTVDGLPSWTPDHVVPRSVPWRALAGAAGALTIVAIVLAIAPRLRPATRRVLVSDRPMDWIATGDTVGDTTNDLLIAPGTGHAPPDGSSVASGDAASMPGALQGWLQRAIAGEQAWETGGDSLAGRDHTAAQSGAKAPAASDDGPDLAADAAAGDPSDPTDDDTQRARAEATNDGNGAAPGAGDGTDPRLFGPTAVAGDGVRDHFELAIAARVRTRQGGADTPQGDVPAAEPDRHPSLAGGGRSDDPINRMPVPAAYESLVRRLYARHAGGPEPAP